MRPSFDPPAIHCDRRRSLGTENGNRLEFLINIVLSCTLDVQFAPARGEAQSTVCSRREAFTIVDVGIAPCGACRIQGYKKRVRSLTRLVDRVGRLLVQE